MITFLIIVFCILSLLQSILYIWNIKATKTDKKLFRLRNKLNKGEELTQEEERWLDLI